MWPWPLTQSHGSCTRHVYTRWWTFPQDSWTYNNNLWSYGPDKAQITHFWPLTSKCDLDLWHIVIGHVRDMPTQHGEHFHKVSWRYNNSLWSYDPDKAQITHFLPLTSKCDLDLWHRVMGLVRDTPTHDYKHFDQVIWKFNNNFRSYSPDKVGRTHARTHGRTHARTYTQKLQIVATMSRSPQAGSTKIVAFQYFFSRVYTQVFLSF